MTGWRLNLTTTRQISSRRVYAWVTMTWGISTMAQETCRSASQNAPNWSWQHWQKEPCSMCQQLMKTTFSGQQRHCLCIKSWFHNISGFMSSLYSDAIICCASCFIQLSIKQQAHAQTCLHMWGQSRHVCAQRIATRAYRLPCYACRMRSKAMWGWSRNECA